MKYRMLLVFILVSVAYIVHAQAEYNLTNCAWTSSSVPSGGTGTYCTTLTASGGDSSADIRVTFQGAFGASGDWTNAMIIATDMTGRWSFANRFGVLSAKYIGPVSDAQYATICADVIHDGSSTEMGSGSTNVTPGASTCSNKIPVRVSSKRKIGATVGKNVLHPNPVFVGQGMTLTATAKSGKYKIVDQKGALIRNARFDGTVSTVSTTDLAPGYYNLVLNGSESLPFIILK